MFHLFSKTYVEIDAVIDNNADGLDNLYRQINDLVQDLQAAKEDRPS